MYICLNVSVTNAWFFSFVMCMQWAKSNSTGKERGPNGWKCSNYSGRMKFKGFLLAR